MLIIDLILFFSHFENITYAAVPAIVIGYIIKTICHMNDYKISFWNHFQDIENIIELIGLERNSPVRLFYIALLLLLIFFTCLFVLFFYLNAIFTS